jgi:hypothetical protein
LPSRVFRVFRCGCRRLPVTAIGRARDVATVADAAQSRCGLYSVRDMRQAVKPRPCNWRAITARGE